jgi:hypothetical protein
VLLPNPARRPRRRGSPRAAGATSRRARTAPSIAVPQSTASRSEPVAHIHPASGGDHAADGRHPDRRRHGLPAAALVGAARGGLSDHRGADLLPRREPGGHHLGHHRAAGEAVRPDAGPEPDVLDEFGGASVITLQFNLSLAIDVAEQEVQAAISGAQNLLPQDLPAPPIYAKVNPGRRAGADLGITSKVMPLTEVEDLADTRIAQKISQIKGVGVVSISGGQRPAVRVVVNPRALAAYGLNIDDLRTTISNANQNGPKGTLDGPISAYTVNTNDQIKRRRLRQRRHRLQERRAGAPARMWPRWCPARRTPSSAAG